MHKPRRPFERIVFTHDFFRIKAGPADDQAINLHRLRALLTPALRGLGLPVSTAISSTAGGTVEVDSIREALGATASPEDWARCFSLPAFPPGVEHYLIGQFANALVVGFGLPVSLMRLLTQARIAFLDVEIDPVRFCADNFFKIRTNDEALDAVLREYHVGDSEIQAYAANVAIALAEKSRRSNPCPATSLALFAGQTPLDAALICGGRLVRLEEHWGAIEAALAGAGQVLFKPHPHGATRSTELFLEAFPGARVCKTNPYEMLLWPNLEKVVALSSGLLKEAEFFGVETVRIVTRDGAFENPETEGAGGRDYRIGPDFATPDCWRRLLQHGGGGAPPRRMPPDPFLQPLRKCYGAWSADLIYRGAPGAAANGLSLPVTLWFATGEPSEACLWSGFSSVEANGVWNDGERAAMHFEADPAEGDVELEFGVRPFLGPGMAVQEAAIAVNSKAVAELGLARPGTVRVRVDAETWNARREKTVEFLFHGAVSPREAGISDDCRKLAWFFQTLKLAAAREPRQP